MIYLLCTNNNGLITIMNNPEYSEALTIDTTEIVTERLCLRFPRTKTEEEQVIELTFNAAHLPPDKEGRIFTSGMTWEPPADISETRQYLQINKENWGADAYNFAIWNADRAPIGRCMIMKDEQPDEWTLGYWMHPKYQGKGYMQEAGKALVAFGFNELGAAKVVARAMHWNIGSQIVLQKCGLQKVSTEEPLYFNKNGTLAEEYLYELLRKDFMSQ